MKRSLPIPFDEFACVVESTFDRPHGSVTAMTYCVDIAGWDSLGHSVLLSRLDRRFQLNIDEADASPTETVGELFERMIVLHVASSS